MAAAKFRGDEKGEAFFSSVCPIMGASGPIGEPRGVENFDPVPIKDTIGEPSSGWLYNQVAPSTVMDPMTKLGVR